MKLSYITDVICSIQPFFQVMSFDLVLFGGTGDLAWRKLMPALFQAFRHGTLPDGGRILGVGRDDLSAEQYRAQIRARFDGVELAKRPSDGEFDRFAALLDFVCMDLSKPQDYAKLADALAQRHAETVVMYVATAPSLFTTVCEQLAKAGLNTPRTRIVLEKPLGHDLASNRAINDAVRQVFGEKQVFRIDHYLGKPAVQNLFALRFGNALFEPLWRREHIATVYREQFADLPLDLPHADPQDRHSWHLFTVQLQPGKLTIDRDTFIERLMERGIGTSVHFIPLHRHPYWRDTYGLRDSDFPVATDIYRRTLSLPIYPVMTSEQIQRVVDAVTQICHDHRH